MTEPEKRSGLEWAERHQIEIIDPDGWRLKDGVQLEDKIPEDEFILRMVVSTISCKRSDAQDYFRLIGEILERSKKTL